MILFTALSIPLILSKQGERAPSSSAAEPAAPQPQTFDRARVPEPVKFAAAMAWALSDSLNKGKQNGNRKK